MSSDNTLAIKDRVLFAILLPVLGPSPSPPPIPQKPSTYNLVGSIPNNWYSHRQA